jgi:hypothetical protein
VGYGGMILVDKWRRSSVQRGMRQMTSVEASITCKNLPITSGLRTAAGAISQLQGCFTYSHKERYVFLNSDYYLILCTTVSYTVRFYMFISENL